MTKLIKNKNGYSSSTLEDTFLIDHKKCNYIVDDVKVFIQQNVGENITIKGICEALELSEAHFTRVFKNKTKMTPYSYVQSEKIKKAKELLKGNHEISEVALMLGFSDQSHFHRIFKKYVFITPNEYKNFFI